MNPAIRNCGPGSRANKGNIDQSRERTSCDEYPFAATQESAGQKKISGLTCVQFYATKVSGSWILRLDHGYGTPVSWTEPCGRGAIPLNQNRGAGGGVGGIVTKYRLLDGDSYYVETPGFDKCDPSAPECEIDIP
ncbi:hypothetical protein GCM10022214_76440 [Actinomadura miaoliensis]|uniref:Deoxyribonuclease NucA/NucB domain-containing protein n=1 Tax=Actinomadura miaoliensis TaxID=430685 RepID=A0ABP7WYQ8_9ACTN